MGPEPPASDGRGRFALPLLRMLVFFFAADATETCAGFKGGVVSAVEATLAVFFCDG